MGTEKGFFPTEEEQAAYEVARRLQYYRRLVTKAREDYADAIIKAKDEDGWTFRDIGGALGVAHSRIFKIYRTRKADPRKSSSAVLRQGSPPAGQGSHSGIGGSSDVFVTGRLSSRSPDGQSVERVSRAEEVAE